MAEFVQTMKDWKRMCDTIKSCDDCPMQKEDGWTYVLCSEGGISSARPEVAEKVIVKWAAEHPEPVYPTWAEFLHEAFCERYPMPYRGDAAWYAFLRETHIPADIAEKLGIEPKEGV